MGGPGSREKYFTGLVGVVLIAGCGSGHPDDPQCYPVTGKVTFKSKPAHFAVVCFIPADSTDERMPAGAIVDENGEFRLQTHKRIDGAEPGEYRITVSWQKPIGSGSDDADTTKELLPSKFQDPAASNLKFTVEPTENEVPPFDLSP